MIAGHPTLNLFAAGHDAGMVIFKVCLKLNLNINFIDPYLLVGARTASSRTDGQPVVLCQGEIPAKA